ncbi:uncharacterized protein LOC103710984 [Phoenix dactylifera]|uniref:Uncharacterized protein LOC103710984 n=1 Tax=Phoenix dactylifera TaxID=42345 RepID=A0A8B7MUN6_PHODC|nr:uncharacterized protein LOC103710984 [Phoenix dactylifera]
MMQGSTAGGAAWLRCSSRGSSWRWPVRLQLILVWSCVLVCLPLFMPWAGKACSASCLDGGSAPVVCDGCSSYGGVGSLVHGWGSSPGCPKIGDVCAGSGSFCFLSTLRGFLDEEDGRQKLSLEASQSSAQPGNVLAYEMSNGGVVSCASVDASSGIHDQLRSEGKDIDGDGIASCKAQLVPDVWIRASSGLTVELDDHAEDIDVGLNNGSSSPHVEINPTMLDWGNSNLYSPSLAFLTVTNMHDDSVLQVYEPFSTDLQFYAYSFENLSLAPGESASISFIFLPRWLGLSSAQLVLQTSFGGFIIHAKGTAVESPYKIEPLVGLDISLGERLNRNLSLYNPFDDMLYVEEVTTWISSSGNSNHSALVICSVDEFQQSSEEFDSSLNDKESSAVKPDELGLSWVDVRPHKQWEMLPHNTETIIGMKLRPHLEGIFFGVICMKLRDSKQEKTDTVIIPLELEVHGRETCIELTGAVSVFFEPLVPCDGKGSIFSLSLRNEASYLLRVVKISEDTESDKLFHLKYMEGLILFPGAVTWIGLISYTPPTDSQDIASEIPGINLNCKLLILTNDSASPLIRIPCLDLVHACFQHPPGSGIVVSDGSYIGLISQQEREKLTNTRTGSLGSIIGESLPTKMKLLEAVKADELILRNWRSQGTTAGISVLEDHELLFPVVQIGSHFSKWISVHNPSQKPVVMQLVLHSGEIIDQCKSSDDLSELTLSSRFTDIGSMKTKVGFSISDSAITEAFVHPNGSALFGPVVFHPSNRCMWMSSALIRNNLSGVEWLSLRAFGGSHSLVLLEGPEPVWNLEFNHDWPMNHNISSADMSLHKETATPSCHHRFSKEIHAKNTGELPLEVMKLKVSGTDCGLDGFMINTCKGFALAPGESMRLLISYQPDFSAAVVHRDLELAMAAGIFVVPMKASLPVYMLNLCRKSFFLAVHWEVSVLIFAAVAIFLLVLIRIVPQSFLLGIGDYNDEVENTMNTKSNVGKPSHIHQSTKVSSSIRKDKKPEVVCGNRYPICQNGLQDSAKGMQVKQDFDRQKKTTFSSPTSTRKPAEFLDSDMSETPQSGNLTIRIVKEKGRRRKRKTTGAGLAAKFEVSSSQSGNSTPSSPLTPNATTPKHGWPLSLDSTGDPFSGVSEEQKHQKKHDVDVPMEARVPEAKKHGDNTWLLSAQEQPPLTGKSTGRSTLLPSATFPSPSWRAPGLAARSFLAATSPIAPHARAPGSKLNKDKAVQGKQNDVLGKEFTYDIWGNHFSDQLLGKPKEFRSKVLDASEGDSQSFFARDPQSLMMMSSAQSASPGHKLPSYDVTCLHQMN